MLYSTVGELSIGCPEDVFDDQNDIEDNDVDTEDGDSNTEDDDKDRSFAARSLATRAICRLTSDPCMGWSPRRFWNTAANTARRLSRAS